MHANPDNSQLTNCIDSMRANDNHFVPVDSEGSTGLLYEHTNLTHFGWDTICTYVT